MTPSPALILASTSPARRKLLERLGLEFTQVNPEVDEAALQTGARDPQQLARNLALAKGQAVAKRNPGAWIIAGDQVCALGNELLGKPGSKHKALGQLTRLAGSTHQLISATALLGPQQEPDPVCEAWLEVAQMTMAPQSQAALERYVEADDPSLCAGSYKLEQRGIALFERIECEDWNAIVGLPLMRLAQLLRQHGFETP